MEYLCGRLNLKEDATKVNSFRLHTRVHIIFPTAFHTRSINALSIYARHLHYLFLRSLLHSEIIFLLCTPTISLSLELGSIAPLAIWHRIQQTNRSEICFSSCTFDTNQWSFDSQTYFIPRFEDVKCAIAEQSGRRQTSKATRGDAGLRCGHSHRNKYSSVYITFSRNRSRSADPIPSSLSRASLFRSTLPAK